MLQTVMPCLITIVHQGNQKVTLYSNKLSTVHTGHKSIEMKLDELGTDSNKLHTIDVTKVVCPLTVEEKGS